MRPDPRAVDAYLSGKYERSHDKERAKNADLEAFKPLLVMFDRAFDKGIKFPEIAIAGHIYIKRTGEKSRFGAGCLMVTDGGKYPDNKWYFTILRNCSLVMGKQYSPDIEKLVTRFSANPVEEALNSAKVTHACCFCAIGLTDQRSITAGYGPICAEKWGLPWGNGEKGKDNESILS